MPITADNRVLEIDSQRLNLSQALKTLGDVVLSFVFTDQKERQIATVKAEI